MGRRALLTAIGVTALLGDPFLTYQEYAQQLYLHPGGISCAKCHGYYGEGRELGETKKPIYRDGKRVGYRVVSIAAPNIQQVPLERLKKQLFHENYQIMPRYPFLTEPEIEAIYYYLNFLAPKLYQQALERQRELLKRRAQQLQEPQQTRSEETNIETPPSDEKNRTGELPPPPPNSLIRVEE